MTQYLLFRAANDHLYSLVTTQVVTIVARAYVSPIARAHSLAPQALAPEALAPQAAQAELDVPHATITGVACYNGRAVAVSEPHDPSQHQSGGSDLTADTGSDAGGEKLIIICQNDLAVAAREVLSLVEPDGTDILNVNETHSFSDLNGSSYQATIFLA